MFVADSAKAGGGPEFPVRFHVCMNADTVIGHT